MTNLEYTDEILALKPGTWVVVKGNCTLTTRAGITHHRKYYAGDTFRLKVAYPEDDYLIAYDTNGNKVVIDRVECVKLEKV